MTTSGDAGNRWWDPMGVWQRTESVLADLAPDQGRAAPSSWNALQAMFDAVRARLVGDPVAFGSGENRVTFTLTSLEATVSHMAAAAGQADGVSLSAEDFTWRSFHFIKASARFGNFHTRFRSRPVLVSAPIDVSATLTGEALNEVLARAAPTFSCEITDAGDLRLQKASHPRWGYLQVLPAVESGTFVLRPSGVGRGAHLWRLGRRVLPMHPSLNIPDWVRLTGVELHPGSLTVQFRVGEWKFDSAELMSLVRNAREPGGVQKAT